MKRVLEHLKEQQQNLLGSSFVRFLQDTRFSPRERLGFLPGVAPFVMGLEDLSRSLLGEELEAPLASEDSQHWALYLKDLQLLGLDGTADFTGMLRLLWGTEGNLARRTLYELTELALGAAPVKVQILKLALHAVGNVGLGAIEQVAREFAARTGRELASIHSLRVQFDASPLADAVELDLLPELEQEALETIDEVFSLFSDLGDQFLTYAQRQLEVARSRPPSALTFQEFGNARLQVLCESVGYSPADTQTVQRYFTFMSSPWGTQRIGTTPPWKSDITDDHTPFELSLAIENGCPEVRFLMEPQRSQNGPTTLRSTWEDGLALNERLSQELGVRLERFNLVKDLFEPVDPHARFALWHAFFLKAGGTPDIKIYLNPAARGPEHARAVVKEALERLGFSSAWRCLSEQALRAEKDQIIYFSLDLSAHRAARVKIYLAHRDITAEELESVMALAKEHVPGEAWVFCQALKGYNGPLKASRSALTCLAFTADDDERPSSVTLHVPVRCYTRSDEESMERIRFLLEPQSHAVLERAVGALASRPLDTGVGLLQWASMRRQGGKVRTTFYLATEAYGVPAQRMDAPQPPVLIPVSPAPDLNEVVA